MQHLKEVSMGLLSKQDNMYYLHLFHEQQADLNWFPNGKLNQDLVDEFKGCNVYAKEKCRSCFAKFMCSGGCAANSYHFHGNINDAYDLGCELQRKRVECAIMLKAAESAAEQSESE